MNKSLITSSLFTMALCATASASNFSVSGAAGVIPAGAPGSTGGTGAAWTVGAQPTSLPTGPGTSTVTVVNPVTSITSVDIAGLNHTWIGDVQFVLKDPSGTRHNIAVRPGFGNTSTFGNQGDYLGGNYSFKDAGSGNLLLPTNSTTTVNPPAGIYEQMFCNAPNVWTSGTLGIDNALLSTISGPAGTWTLECFDWAGGDYGGFSGWTLNGTDLSGPVAFCEPTQAGVIACACGNPNGAGVGCANTGSSGASIAFSGSANLAGDATDPGVFSLTGNSMLSGASCIILQGDAVVAGGSTTFGAGVRCVGGQLLRLYVKSISAGSATGPVAGDRSISNQIGRAHV